MTATSLALKCELSPNTLSKFTSGSTKTLSEQSLAKVVDGLGLASASDLDTDNPLNDPRVLLRRIVDAIPEDSVPGLLRELEARFPSK